MKKDFQIVTTSPAPKPVDAFLLEPWFRSREEAVAIRRLQTLGERGKFADFFALNGCLRCGARDKRHFSQALCSDCHSWILQKLQQAMRARERGEI